MNSIFATEKGLPPGLWLPTADEPADKYLTENYAHKGRDFADIVDYGSLVVALAVLEQDTTGRVSVMPTWRDFNAMREAGYGLTANTITRRYRDEHYWGLTRVQRALGFYSRAYAPSVDETIERFQWVADYAYALDPLPEEEATGIESFINWGAARNLTPGGKRVYELLRGDTTVLRKMFGIETRNRSRQYSKTDVLRVGARALAKYGKPPSVPVFNEMYADEFVSSPYAAVRLVYGTMTAFWQEFDRIPPSTAGLTQAELLTFGMRWAITNERTDITKSDIEYLSSELRFPSYFPIQHQFGGVRAYRKMLAGWYEKYLTCRQALLDSGVSVDVIGALGLKFEASDSYIDRLQHHAQTLVKLSAAAEGAQYVVRLMQTGLDLLDDSTYEMQQEDLARILGKLHITGEAKRFVYGLIPRFYPDKVAR